MQHLKDKIQLLQQNLNEARYQLDEKGSAILILEEKIRKLENEKDLAETTIRDLEYDKDQLQTDKNNLSGQVQEKDTRIFDLESANRNLQHDVDNYKYKEQYPE